MNGQSFAFAGRYLFRFHIKRLANFAEAARLRAAVARDTGSDFELLPVVIRLNAGIEVNGSSAHLNLECAEKEESL
jgi:hypothetical protein